MHSVGGREQQFCLNSVKNRPSSKFYEIMAFMAMKKNLDDRARKKAFDEIFDKFDHNKNGKKTIM